MAPLKPPRGVAAGDTTPLAAKFHDPIADPIVAAHQNTELRQLFRTARASFRKRGFEANNE
jgi:hypothetical protein